MPRPASLSAIATSFAAVLLATTALAQTSAAPATLDLPTIDVAGSRERANGPVDGFAAQRSATGTKTDSAIEETPAAITVIPRQQLDVLDARTLNEALRYSAGVNPSTRGVSGSRYDLLSFRGFGNIGSVNNLYLNGMRLLGGGYTTPQIDTYALERIELLKGPASILYGQANPAGLINEISKLPTEAPLHEVGIEGGSYGTIQGTADLSGKLTEDGRVLGRITGLFRQSDGLVTSDYARERRVMLQPSVTFRPDANTTVTLQGFYQRDPYGGYYGAVPAYGSVLPNPLGRIPRDFYDGEPGHEKYDRTQYGVGYQAEHRFNDHVALRQNFRYFRAESAYTSVYTSGAVINNRTLPRGLNNTTGHFNDFNVDTTAVFDLDTGPVHHKVLAGVDYLRADLNAIFRNSTVGIPSLDLFNPVYGAAIRVPAISVSSYQTTDQVGFYAQEQAKFGGLTVLGGLRQDLAGVDTLNRLTNVKARTYDRALTGRAGVIYNFDNGLAPYYAYSQSFTPSTGTDYSGAPFKPTYGSSNEWGVKYAPPGWKSLFTIDYFDTYQTNVLTTDTVHPQFSIQTGEVRSRGVEAEAHASPLPGLNLVAAYTYIDARYTKDNSGLQGKVLNAAPKNSASGFADYTIQSGPLAGLGFGAGTRYIGSSQGSASNAFVVKGTVLFDAVAHYEIGQLFPQMKSARLQVNASNLADRRYVAACYSVSACYFGAGRVVLASLKYRW